MTVEKVVRFAIQSILYAMAALLADLPWWQFLGVIFFVIIADRIGQIK